MLRLAWYPTVGEDPGFRPAQAVADARLAESTGLVKDAHLVTAGRRAVLQ